MTTKFIKTAKKATPRRIHPSLKKEKIHPVDYLKFDHRFSCQDCSYFAPESKSCTLGYNSSNHLKEVQEHSYALSGSIAFCRFLEID